MLLASGGFGTPWGHTRSFANRQADNFDVGHGYNWRVAQWPYLTALGNGPLVATFDANNSIWFDAVDGGYAARHGETASLVYDAVADVFRLTDNLGNATEYNGSTLAFSAHIDAAGNRTAVVSNLNDADTLQTWRDGAWADLTTTLYRYYKAPPFTPDCDCGSSSSSSAPSDPAYLAHLIKYVIEPDSYARLAADPNLSGDPAGKVNLVPGATAPLKSSMSMPQPPAKRIIRLIGVIVRRKLSSVVI